MTTPPSMPPAGWYPDPAGPDNIRYWDGLRWTDRVQPKSVPPPPAAPPVAGPSAPAMPDAPPAVPHVTPPPPAPQPAAPPQPYPQPMPPQQPPAPYGYGPHPYGPAPGQGPGQPQLMSPYGYAPAPPMVRPPGRIGPDGQILSGWWRRVGGYLIDGLISGIPAGIAWTIAALIIMGNGGSVFDDQAMDALRQQIEAGVTVTNDEVYAVFGPGFWTASAFAIAVWAIISIWNGVYLVSRSGQTLADRLINVRKVMIGRTVPSFAVALSRWLIPNVLLALIGWLVPFGYLLSWLDYLWASWDGKSQTVHDKICRTYVERTDLVGPPVPRR